MRRVTGIGGIFFKAQDPGALRTWYKEHLGIDVQEQGGAAFPWIDSDGNPAKSSSGNHRRANRLPELAPIHPAHPE